MDKFERKELMSKIYMNSRNRQDFKVKQGDVRAMFDDSETMEIVNEYVLVMENNGEVVIVNSNK